MAVYLRELALVLLGLQTKKTVNREITTIVTIPTVDEHQKYTRTTLDTN